MRQGNGYEEEQKEESIGFAMHIMFSRICLLSFAQQHKQ
jgi:hypothetical protein